MRYLTLIIITLLGLSCADRGLDLTRDYEAEARGSSELSERIDRLEEFVDFCGRMKDAKERELARMILSGKGF